MAGESSVASVPLLAVRGLNVEFTTETGINFAVRDISWDIYPGEVLGVVGESGSGKTAAFGSILKLLPSPPAQIRADTILFEGRDLSILPEREMQKLRGRAIALIFQNPMSAFNPVIGVGDQISEAVRVHDRSVTSAAARDRAISLLALVGVPSPAVRYAQFPHEFSGGMLQRAMIAMAIANQPRLIIADEPTTALDVTIQAQVLDLFRLVLEQTGAALVLITHDLGVIAEMADRVLVMYAGRIVEASSVHAIFASPRHPYTAGLLASLPRLEQEGGRLKSIPGLPPIITSIPPGCAFAPRCQISNRRIECLTLDPTLTDRQPGEHAVACHFPMGLSETEGPLDPRDSSPTESPT